MPSVPRLSPLIDNLPVPLQAAFWMISAAFCMSCMHAVIRYLSEEMHTFEIVQENLPCLRLQLQVLCIDNLIDVTA